MLMFDHCATNRLIHPAQNGCAKGQYECTDHLLLTNRIWHQVHSKNRSLSVAWIDYKKAFDSVPHNWIIECLHLFNFPSGLINCLEQLLPLWSTTLFLHLPHIAPIQLCTVSVKCGIFQGDTLSPLLFCLALNPLSYLLGRIDGYKVSADVYLTDLLYMDDLKIFARSDECLFKLVDTVQRFSDAIQMDFGISKCAKLTIKRGKVVQTGSMPVLSGTKIHEWEIAGLYHYLGFPEGGGTNHKHSKDIILNEFKRRLRLIWTSLLYARFKVQATNTICIPLLSYGFGIVDWTVAEVSQLDILIYRMMVAANSLHPCSAVERLYLPHRLEGRGLLNVEHLYYRCIIMLSQHLQTSDDALVRMCFLLDTSLPSR